MSRAVTLSLHAVVCTVHDARPLVLAIERDPPALPSGPFEPERDRTLELALRGWVREQTALPLGYVEQLYTFGDQGRTATPDHVVSVGYLALTRMERPGANWRSWYAAFPWEDWRDGRPTVLDRIEPVLREWAQAAPDERPPSINLGRMARFRLAFAMWDEERVLERYELLYEAGLVREAQADGRAAPHPLMDATGRPMAFDHRRILATAIARLRAKVKYRPVVFELMPDTFTLSQLQATVETIFGRVLHTQNFRRLVERAELVEPTGGKAPAKGGRPAALYRFRRAVLSERPAPGLAIR